MSIEEQRMRTKLLGLNMINCQVLGCLEKELQKHGGNSSISSFDLCIVRERHTHVNVSSTCLHKVSLAFQRNV